MKNGPNDGKADRLADRLTNQPTKQTNKQKQKQSRNYLKFVVPQESCFGTYGVIILPSVKLLLLYDMHIHHVVNCELIVWTRI